MKEQVLGIFLLMLVGLAIGFTRPLDIVICLRQRGWGDRGVDLNGLGE
jgi:hypothetical protein